jgi:hypothetical protein
MQWGRFKKHLSGKTNRALEKINCTEQIVNDCAGFGILHTSNLRGL